MAYSPSLNDIKSILNKYTSKDYELKCENRYDGKLELWLKGVFEEIVKTPGTSTSPISNLMKSSKILSLKQNLKSSKL